LFMMSLVFILSCIVLVNTIGECGFPWVLIFIAAVVTYLYVKLKLLYWIGAAFDAVYTWMNSVKLF